MNQPSSTPLSLTALHFEGGDAASFLQGYLTSDTAKLTASAGQPTALTTLKGRVLANGWALATDSGVALLLETSLSETTLSFLKKYLAFSKTKAATLDDTALAALLSSASLPGLPAPLEPLEPQLVEHRFALVSAPVSESFLPQMLGLTELGAVDFNKGCYLGQEVVARAEHRGAVKRSLTTVALAEPGLQPGTEIQTAAGKNVGTLICVDPGSSQALAVLTVLEDNVALSADGIAVQLLGP